MLQRKAESPMADVNSPGALKLDKAYPKQAPFVAANRERKIVIVSFVGYSGYSFITRTPEWVGLDHLSQGEFEKEFKVVVNYPAVKAGSHFLETAERVGATPAVLDLLKAIVDGKTQVGYEGIGAQLNQEAIMATSKKKAVAKKAAPKKAAPKAENKGKAAAAPADKAPKKTRPAAAKKEASEGSGSKYRQSVIKVNVESNPRREGTKAHDMFSKIKNGMTVQDYVDAGGDLGYLAYDVRRKHVDLEAPAA